MRSPPSTGVVRFVVAASIVVTAFHFTDNAVSIEDGKFPLANWLLLAYAFAGISSLGHFLSGSPDEFTTRGVISILADGLAGATVLTVALWSFKSRAGGAAKNPA